MISSRLFFLVIVIYTHTFFLYAQKPKVAYEDVTLDADLAYDQVEHMLVDSDGFTWIATSTGLHKFDGYDYNTFLHNANDKNSISENFSTYIFEDSKGYIWVGTFNNGLNVFDKKTRSFYCYRYLSDSLNSLTSNKIARAKKAIVEDKNGNIWVSTENGLNKINHQTHMVERFYGDLNGHIVYDRHKNLLWIANKSLKAFDIKTKKIKQFTHTSLPFKQVSDVVLSEQGLLWLGTEEGLFVFDPKSESYLSIENYFKLNKINSPRPIKWTTQSISALYKDSKNHLWVSIDKNFIC